MTASSVFARLADIKMHQQGTGGDVAVSVFDLPNEPPKSETWNLANTLSNNVQYMLNLALELRAATMQPDKDLYDEDIMILIDRLHECKRDMQNRCRDIQELEEEDGN